MISERPKMGVISTFGELRNAEYENIQRIVRTSEKLGIDCHVLDIHGKALNGNSSSLNAEDLDFVISLHFMAPKCFDAYTYVALWNPVRFYHQWGYRRYANNLLSYDDFLSCRSDDADTHIVRLTQDDPTRLPPSLRFFHSLSTPIHPPTRRTDRRLFYCGVNWEKLSRRHGRYNELFHDLDSTGLVDFYGPRNMGGVKPWAGYDCYRGELPFDGVSLVNAIARAGVALVLSSEAHKESALMSNRLFEACAAGAVVIADENPFVRKFFSDTVLYLNGRDSKDFQARSILDHLSWINSHPDEARDLAVRSQALFLEEFSLDRCLTDLVAQHSRRRADLQERTLAARPSAKVNCAVVVLDPSKRSYIRTAGDLSRQLGIQVSATFLVDRNSEEAVSNELKAVYPDADFEVLGIPDMAVEFNADDCGADVPRPARIGKHLSELIQGKPSDYVSFIFDHETLFRNHFSTMARRLEDSPSAPFCIADYLVDRHTHGSEAPCELYSFRIRNRLLPESPHCFGSAHLLFRRGALRDALLSNLQATDLLTPVFLAVALEAEGRFCYSHRPTSRTTVPAPPLVRRLRACEDAEVWLDYRRSRDLRSAPEGGTHLVDTTLPWPKLSFSNSSQKPLSSGSRWHYWLRHAVAPFLPKRLAVVVWGAGSAGNHVIRSLPIWVKVVAVVDTFQGGKGFHLAGHPIGTPKEALSAPYDRVLIASVFHHEIRDQLYELGVAAESIAVATHEACLGGGKADWKAILRQ
jgi:hypothetical protein